VSSSSWDVLVSVRLAQPGIAETIETRPDAGSQSVSNHDPLEATLSAFYEVLRRQIDVLDSTQDPDILPGLRVAGTVPGGAIDCIGSSVESVAVKPLITVQVT